MNNAQYKFISYGECKVPDTTCPAITTPVAPDGCYYTKEKNEKGCYLPKLVCKPTEPICPAITTPVPPDGCFYKKEKNTDGCYIPKLICKEEPKTCPVYQMPLVKDGCKVKTQKDENGCDVPKIICKEEPKPIDGLKRKLEEALTRLFKRLDNSGMSNTDKITKLQGVVEKLKALIDAKPQYTDLLNFAIDKINAQIALYQNDGGDILNILQ